MIFAIFVCDFFCDFVIFVCYLLVISRKVHEQKISDFPLGSWTRLRLSYLCDPIAPGAKSCNFTFTFKFAGDVLRRKSLYLALAIYFADVGL